VELFVNRSIDLSAFPIIKGNIPFSILSHGERSEGCGSKPEAYAIDTYKDWKSIRDKLNSDKIIDEPNLDNSTVLVYLFGQLLASGNQFAINKIEGIPARKSIFVNIDFAGGVLESLSCPFIIITIPKTGYKTVVFEVRNVPSDSPHLIDLD
jgi:hypothetical protein